MSGSLQLINLSHPLMLVVFCAALALVPFIVLSVTCFIKLSVVFGILRNALGAQQVPSGAVVTLLSISLTGLVMAPVAKEAVENSKRALSDVSAVQSQGVSKQSGAKKLSELETLFHGLKAAAVPFQSFLEKHSRPRERMFFSGLSQQQSEQERGALGSTETLFTLIPSFVLSELHEAFAIGFSIFIPFLIIDLVVANILMGLGMMMVSPVTISLPIKLVLFVLCDGWFLLSRGLVMGYQ